MVISVHLIGTSCSTRIPQLGTSIQSPGSLPLIGTSCSTRIPQLGTSIQSRGSLPPLRRRAGLQCRSSGFQKLGGSHSTQTIEQGAPFHSSAEEASDSGIKTVEFVDPISPTKLVDDQLPSLLSMAIDGLPPCNIANYVDEAEKRLNEYVERYHNVSALASYYQAGLSSTAYGHPEVINVDRLVAIAINYGLQFLVDDLFFDDPNEFLQDQYGISHDIRRSPHKIQEYYDHLDAVFGQQVQPRNPAPLIETIMKEAGQYTLEVSNPEWFNYFVACLNEHHHGNVDSEEDIRQGHNLSFQDVESYAIMRGGNIGGTFIQLMVELASDNYIPSILRTSPYMKNLTKTTCIHLGYVNDVFSYHKESSIEQNPRNLITVLLECEGKPFVQTVHRAIDLANTYGREILDLESQAWTSSLQKHMQSIKALIAGNVYFSYVYDRYRHPDSCFPELRDMTSSWRTLPPTKGPRL